MGFEVHQVRKLRAKLRSKHIRTRLADGNELSYLEGWHVIAEANRIFGFDGWNRETVETRCVWTKNNGSRFACAYITRIRITVKAADTTIVREGSGAGEAHEASPGLAHERAAKQAETDATKRALMTFGNAFGLSLYAGGQEANGKAGPRKPHSQASAGKAGPASLNSIRTEMDPTEASGSAAGNAGEGGQGRTPEASTAAEAGKDLETTRPYSPALPPWPEIDPFEEAARWASGRIDKSKLTLSEPQRLRDPAHLRRVAAKPCLVCGRNRAQAHHLKYLQPQALGRKVSDEFTVPLCSTHHRELHASGGEQKWWQAKGIDPEPVASGLWRDSSRSEAGQSRTTLDQAKRAPDISAVRRDQGLT